MAIDIIGQLPIAESPVTIFDVTANGTSAYTISGEDNRDLDLIPGQTYFFNINTPGQPFWIQTSEGAYNSGNVYTNDGLEGNGSDSGQITFKVPLDPPAKLYYVSENSSDMAGQIITEKPPKFTWYTTPTESYYRFAFSPVEGGSIMRIDNESDESAVGTLIEKDTDGNTLRSINLATGSNIYILNQNTSYMDFNNTTTTTGIFGIQFINLNSFVGIDVDLSSSTTDFFAVTTTQSVTIDQEYDVIVLGGGGGGGAGFYSGNTGGYQTGSGGGGGSGFLDVGTLQAGTYSVVIGSGGSAGSGTTAGGSGGTTTISNLSAGGGNGGNYGSYAQNSAFGNGGNGGSGGGAGVRTQEQGAQAAPGGVDGANGQTTNVNYANGIGTPGNGSGVSFNENVNDYFDQFFNSPNLYKGGNGGALSSQYSTGGNGDLGSGGNAATSSTNSTGGASGGSGGTGAVIFIRKDLNVPDFK